MTTTSRSGRRCNTLIDTLLAGSLLAALAAGLAGCGDDRASGRPGATAGAGPSGAAATSASASGSPSGVAPAAGKQVSSPVFTLRVPAGWRLRSMIRSSTSAFAPDSSGQASIGFVPAYGQSVSDERLVAEALRDHGWAQEPHVEEPAVVDGQRMVHLSGPIGRGKRADYYVRIYRDYEVYLDVETRGTAAQQAAVVDAVLASWHWKQPRADR